MLKSFDLLIAEASSFNVYRMMLEGAASEHAARMTAMENATNNANEVLRNLLLNTTVPDKQQLQPN